MNATTFNTKQEYLAWRTDWRARYAELSKSIRNVKAQRKDPSPMTRALAQSRCYRLRQQAHAMLAERKQSKILAQQQYLAGRATAQAAA